MANKKKMIRLVISTIVLLFFIVILILIYGFSGFKFNPEGIYIILPFVAAMAGLAALYTLTERRNKEDTARIEKAEWPIKNERDDSD